MRHWSNGENRQKNDHDTDQTEIINKILRHLERCQPQAHGPPLNKKEKMVEETVYDYGFFDYFPNNILYQYLAKISHSCGVLESLIEETPVGIPRVFSPFGNSPCLIHYYPFSFYTRFYLNICLDES